LTDSSVLPTRFVTPTAANEYFTEINKRHNHILITHTLICYSLINFSNPQEKSSWLTITQFFLQGANAQVGLVMYNANNNPGIYYFIYLLFSMYIYKICIVELITNYFCP